MVLIEVFFSPSNHGSSSLSVCFPSAHFASFSLSCQPSFRSNSPLACFKATHQLSFLFNGNSPWEASVFTHWKPLICMGTLSSSLPAHAVLLPLCFDCDFCLLYSFFFSCLICFSSTWLMLLLFSMVSRVLGAKMSKTWRTSHLQQCVVLVKRQMYECLYYQLISGSAG